MTTNNIEKLPKTVTKEVFIFLTISGCLAGDISCHGYDISELCDDKLLITSKKITFKLPQNINIKGEVIKKLEDQKETIQADFHMKLKEVQDKIDSLLVIEHNPKEEST